MAKAYRLIAVRHTLLQSSPRQLGRGVLAVADCCCGRTAAGLHRAAARSGGRRSAAADPRSRRRHRPRWAAAWAPAPAARAAAAWPLLSQHPARRSCPSPSHPQPCPFLPSMTTRCADVCSLPLTFVLLVGTECLERALPGHLLQVVLHCAFSIGPS